MPIETDNSNIDFKWNFSKSNDQQDASYSLRLHKTDEYGWTVSFLNDVNRPEFSFPASMFSEINDYIQKYINPSTTLHFPEGVRGGTSFPAKRGEQALSMPKIDGIKDSTEVVRPTPRPMTVNEAVVAEGNAVQIDSASKEQEGIFLPSGHTVDEIMESLGEDSVSFESFSVPDSSSENRDDIPEVERESILNERSEALNKKKSGGIKRL